MTIYLGLCDSDRLKEKLFYYVKITFFFLERVWKRTKIEIISEMRINNVCRVGKGFTSSVYTVYPNRPYPLSKSNTVYLEFTLFFILKLKERQEDSFSLRVKSWWVEVVRTYECIEWHEVEKVCWYRFINTKIA